MQVMEEDVCKDEMIKKFKHVKGLVDEGLLIDLSSFADLQTFDCFFCDKGVMLFSCLMNHC